MNNKWYNLVMAIVNAFYRLIIGQDIDATDDIVEVSDVYKMFSKIIEAFEQSVILGCELTEENERLIKEIDESKTFYLKETIRHGQEVEQKRTRIRELSNTINGLEKELSISYIKYQDITHSKAYTVGVIYTDNRSDKQLLNMVLKTKNDSSATKINKIKAVRQILNIGLIEAKEIVDSN